MGELHRDGGEAGHQESPRPAEVPGRDQDGKHVEGRDRDVGADQGVGDADTDDEQDGHRQDVRGRPPRKERFERKRPPVAVIEVHG